MSIDTVVEVVTMASLALVSVGLWTLRVALTARSRRVAGAIVAAVEASVFAVVFGSLLANLDAPARIFGYALGVAAGTILGMSADQRMSQGQSDVRIVVPGAEVRLVEALRDRGWPATSMPGSGLTGRVTVIFVSVDDERVSALLDDVRELAPDAFWTVEALQRFHQIELDGRFFGLGGSHPHRRVVGARARRHRVHAGTPRHDERHPASRRS